MGDAQRIVHLDEQGRVAVSDILQGLKPGDPVIIQVTAAGQLLISPALESERPWDAIEDTYAILKEHPGARAVLRARDEEDRHG